ncbi:hypothetical protein ACFPOE_21355 [Caenimonas terrae]|uniref:Uncharacterized protein n=1 Tax=Caenimonas terrae TaxID=696074 RepID=A0ABW0NHI6_9BURK
MRNETSREAPGTPAIDIDFTLAPSNRPLAGYDVEEWRGRLKLSKFNAEHALGCRNPNQYNKLCHHKILPQNVELLIRLYDEIPKAAGWDSYTLRELFDRMYADDLAKFAGTEHQVAARVDLGKRFTKMLGRSHARRYDWLESDPKKNEKDQLTHIVIECLLAKLKQADDPREVLERLAKKVLMLRGFNLDSELPVPTPERPPVRHKAGRKSSSERERLAGAPLALAAPKATRAPSRDIRAIAHALHKEETARGGPKRTKTKTAGAGVRE